MDKNLFKTYFSFFILAIFLISHMNSDINIHIIPHTHLDPGWLYTAEEYYTIENSIYRMSTAFTLNKGDMNV